MRGVYWVRRSATVNEKLDTVVETNQIIGINWLWRHVNVQLKILNGRGWDQYALCKYTLRDKLRSTTNHCVVLCYLPLCFCFAMPLLSLVLPSCL